MADIRIYGDPILRKTAKPINEFTEELQPLIASMKQDLYVHDGVGLAAPQIGHSIRLAVIDATIGVKEPLVFINPQIFFFSEETEDYDEGCLSIPGISEIVNRPSIVSVRAINELGKEFVLERVDGLLSRTIQHEVDHLNGILFVDRLTPVRRQLISGKLKKLVKAHQNSTPL